MYIVSFYRKPAENAPYRWEDFEVKFSDKEVEMMRIVISSMLTSKVIGVKVMRNDEKAFEHMLYVRIDSSVDSWSLFCDNEEEKPNILNLNVDRWVTWGVSPQVSPPL